MAEMGEGYGNEYRLLPYLGRHRQALDKAITIRVEVFELPLYRAITARLGTNLSQGAEC